MRARVRGSFRVYTHSHPNTHPFAHANHPHTRMEGSTHERAQLTIHILKHKTIYARTHTRTRMRAHMRAPIHAHTHTHSHPSMHPCAHPYTHVPMHARTQLRTHACTGTTHAVPRRRTHTQMHACTHPTRTRKGTHARAKGTHARSYPPMRHTRAYTCAHARMRADTHTRAHTHPNVLTHALKHPSIHPSIHAPTQPSMHVWLPVRAYTCVCVGMCIHASVHTPVCSYQGSDSAYILNRRSHDSM